MTNIMSLQKLSEEGSLNRRQAIRLYCLLEGSDETPKKCSCTGCALYPYRTGRGKQDPAARDQAIKKECMDCMGSQPKLITDCGNCGCPLYEFRGYIKQKKS